MRDEIEMGLFEPEVLLPTQMSWGARGDDGTQGARALMLAVLEEAMLCIERGRRRRHSRTRRLAAEAETWMRSDCREWLFSFASICDVLGIDTDAVRVRLLPNVDHPANGGPAARAPLPQPWGLPSAEATLSHGRTPVWMCEPIRAEPARPERSR